MLTDFQIDTAHMIHVQEQIKEMRCIINYEVIAGIKIKLCHTHFFFLTELNFSVLYNYTLLVT